MLKYTVIETEDINKHLNTSEVRRFYMMIKKISTQRYKEGQDRDPKYEVFTTKEMEEKEKEKQREIYKAVESALKAEREKIKKVIPNKKVVIEPDPERLTDEGAEKVGKAFASGASDEEIKEIEKKHPLKPSTVIKKKVGVTNAKNKS
jgi:hypothetical protein